MDRFAGSREQYGTKFGPWPSYKTELALFFLLLATISVFNSFPGIDLAVSHLFFSADGFWLSRQPVLVFVRDLNRQLPGLVILYFGWCLVSMSFRRSWYAGPPPHVCLFVLSSYFFGAGFIVHFAKELFDRARPRDIVEFAGRLDFTAAGQFFGACKANCSFVSGEAGSAIAILSILAAVAPHRRRRVAAFLVPAIVMFSLNRVVVGAHFLSDVVCAWIATTLVMLLLWRVLSSRADFIDSRVQGYLFGRI